MTIALAVSESKAMVLALGCLDTLWFGDKLRTCLPSKMASKDSLVALIGITVLFRTGTVTDCDKEDLCQWKTSVLSVSI